MRRGARMRAASPEMIMAMRDRLELTDEQIATLDELRQESVALRNSHRAAMAEMRSQLQAGQIRRGEMMAFMEELRESAPAIAEQRRERIEAVLSQDQLEQLQQMRDRGRAFARGRASARRGSDRGMRRPRPAPVRGRGWNGPRGLDRDTRGFRAPRVGRGLRAR